MPEPFHPGVGPVVFLSDSHLGAPIGPADRSAWLASFIEGLRGKIGGLFLVGDLFDFWFEYRRAVPKGHFRILKALEEIVRTGVPCVYFGGNHDFWAGSYLKREIGLTVSDGPLSLEIQGRRVFVAHGDGLGKGDRGYKILKRILRNRVCIALYRSIHPDLGIPLAERVSALSRRHTTPREILVPKLVRDIAVPRLREGHDAVIIGHVHFPTHLALPEGEFVILGDWVESFTFLSMEDGELSLMRYHPDRTPERIAMSTP